MAHESYGRPRAGVTLRQRSPAINPTLYGLLVTRFGSVLLSAPGEQARYGRPRYNRGTKEVSAYLTDKGEHYRICCPYCNDTAHRLYVGHLWMVPDPITGKPMRQHATCFNEDCLRRHYRDFEDSVWGLMSSEVRAQLQEYHKTQFAPVGADEDDDGPLAEVALPGEVIPLDQLPRTHPANGYLRTRGFDPRRLATEWGVGYCRNAPAYPAAIGRIIVPVIDNCKLVGWQGRWVGDDWKKQGAQKYYFLRSFRKSRTLYGHDQAADKRAVVICEGVTDVWAYGPGSVALFGKKFHAKQLERLAAWSTGLAVVMLDSGVSRGVGEKYPERAAAKYAESLTNLRDLFSDRVVEVDLPAGHDPANFSRDVLHRIVREAVVAAGRKPHKFGLDD